MITQLVLYPALIWGLSALYFQIFLRAEKQFTYNRLFLLLSLVTGLIIPFLNSFQFLQFIKTSDSVFYVITSPEILITSSISKITENNQIYGDIFLTIYLFVATSQNVPFGPNVDMLFIPPSPQISLLL